MFYIPLCTWIVPAGVKFGFVEIETKKKREKKTIEKGDQRYRL